VVVSYDHIVLLIGQVPDDSVRGRVTALVEALPKVSRVYNQLAVAPVPSPAQMSQDAWITTKVKSQMVVTKDLNAGQVKVITEDNVVYLMGIVTHDQAQLAVDVARQVNGVDRVVKLFEYTNL
jgi:osmotically-inducible protein OsmY